MLKSELIEVIEDVYDLLNSNKPDVDRALDLLSVPLGLDPEEETDWES